MKSGRFNFHGSEFDYIGDVAISTGAVYFRRAGDYAVLETRSGRCIKEQDDYISTDKATEMLMIRLLELCGG